VIKGGKRKNSETPARPPIGDHGIPLGMPVHLERAIKLEQQGENRRAETKKRHITTLPLAVQRAVADYRKTGKTPTK
jgi:hypothetical protein